MNVLLIELADPPKTVRPRGAIPTGPALAARIPPEMLAQGCNATDDAEAAALAWSLLEAESIQWGSHPVRRCPRLQGQSGGGQ